MAELTLTGYEDSEPPHVQVRVDAEPDTLLQNVVVRRDGQRIRARIPNRVPRLIVDDYEPEYGREMEYTVEGDVVPTDEPMVDETWDDFDDWSGDTDDWRLPEGGGGAILVAENLVVDPYMETDKWTLQGGGGNADAELEQQDAGLLVTATSSNSSNCLVDYGPMPVDEGVWYRFQGRITKIAVDDWQWIRIRYDVEWFDENDESLRFDVAYKPNNNYFGGPGSLQAPDDAVYAVISMGVSGFREPGDFSTVTEGDQFWIGEPIVVEGRTAVPFFTGDSENSARWLYEWSGEPGESTSLKYDNDQQLTLTTIVDDATLELSEPTELPFNTVEVSDPHNVVLELLEVNDDTYETCATITSSETGTRLETHDGTMRTDSTGSYTVTIDSDNREVVVSGTGWTIRADGNCAPQSMRFTAQPDGYQDRGIADIDYRLGPDDKIACTSDKLFILDRVNDRIVRVDAESMEQDLEWDLPMPCVDIDICNYKQHIWLAAHSRNHMYEYEQDGTQVRDINVTLPAQVEGTALISVTWSANGSQPIIWCAFNTANGNQRFVFVDQNGTNRRRIGDRATSAVKLVSPGEFQGDLWAVIPSFNVIRYYRYQSGWNVRGTGEWRSQATSLAIAPDGDVSSGWQKFELWGDRVRESESTGKYTGREWELKAPARDIATPLDGHRFYAIEGDIVRLYDKKTTLGDVKAVAILSEIGDPFELSDTITIYPDSAFLVHPENPSSLSVRIEGLHKCKTGCDASGIAVRSTSRNEITHEANITEIEPPGRRTKVINRFGERRLPDWDLELIIHDLQSRDDLLAALQSQVRLALRSPAEWEWDLPDGWYSVGDVDESRMTEQDLFHQKRNIVLPLTPGERPAVVEIPAWTYDDVLAAYGTLEALESSGDTWLQVLSGDVSVNA